MKLHRNIKIDDLVGGGGLVFPGQPLKIYPFLPLRGYFQNFCMSIQTHITDFFVNCNCNVTSPKEIRGGGGIGDFVVLIVLKILSSLS